MSWRWSLTFALILLTCALALRICVSANESMVDSRLATTPPMGWNSWNKFGCQVNEQLIREVADSMVGSGMRDAGYKYINIDDCWQISRDSAGNIVADPASIPNGIKALADYVHEKGFKFGIYTDACSLTCGKRPGSLDHELQDARTYASWGVDYVKVDWCYAKGLDPEVQYAKFRDRPQPIASVLGFSMCYGADSPGGRRRAASTALARRGRVCRMGQHINLGRALNSTLLAAIRLSFRFTDSRDQVLANDSSEWASVMRRY